MKDWQIRALKTFVQVFLGTLIPAVTISMGTPPTTWAKLLGVT